MQDGGSTAAVLAAVLFTIGQPKTKAKGTRQICEESVVEKKQELKADAKFCHWEEAKKKLWPASRL